MTHRAISTTGRAIRRHLLLTAVLTGVVVALIVALEVHLVSVEKDRMATATADRVAAVSEVLAELDFSRGAESGAEVAAVTDPIVSLGMVDRIKVWRVEGDMVEVVHSDEQRVIGDRRPFDDRLARRLDRGEVVVSSVPDDHEHRHEEPGAMREAYVGFTDATGTPMRMELYVATHAEAALLESLRLQVPVIAGSLILLSALLVPLSLRTVRRIDRLSRERHDALAYALTTSERVRHDLAQRLHDGVIQDLAAAGFALNSLSEGEQDADRASMMARIGDVLTRDTDELRSLAQASAPVRERELARHLKGLPLVELSDIDLSVDEPAEPPAASVAGLLWPIAAELVINAVKHAQARHIAVQLRVDGSGTELVVRDDGVGYVPEATEPGHLGLLLVEQAVATAGGTVDLDGGAGGTVATVRVPPPSGAALDEFSEPPTPTLGTSSTKE